MSIAKNFGTHAIQINRPSIRKFIIKSLGFLFVSVVLTIPGYAQTDSVRWSLTSAATITGDAFGNVVPAAQTLSNLVVRSYNGGVCQKSAPDAGGAWVADIGEDASRYIEFAVSPAAGYNFTVSSVRFFIGWAGTANIRANVYYSSDPTFSSRTQLGSTISLSSVGVPTSFSLNVPVNDGSSFYVRVYPWAITAFASGRSCGLFDVAILGSTSSGSTPSLIVNPSSLSFGTIALNTTQDFSYVLAGSQLSPASGNITVTTPTGFTVSTTSGSGYTSSLSVPYSGGALSSTTIYTRFMPTSAITYSGNVTNAGGGATTKNVSVTGSGTSNIAGIFVSLTGSNSNPGTYDLPFQTIPYAVSAAHPGDTIFVRSGRYSLSTTITISTSGTSSNLCCLYGYPGDATRPILDFSAMAMSGGNRGIILSGQYWHIKGFEIYRAGDNGMNISGSNNIIEFCALYENRDSGLQLGGGASYNHILNCDSYFNYDSTGDVLTAGGNADGFSPKLDVGTGNYFYGCRAWQNSDDGWDGYLRPATGMTTTLENCWSWKNGYLKDGVTTYTSMNGNGIKMGGSDAKDLAHNFIVKNCLSFRNKAKGFDQNSNAGSITLYNCTAANNNGQNFMLNSSGVTYDPTSVFTVINCAALGTASSFKTGTILTTNNFATTAVNYLSTDTTGISGPRKSDGSLPDITYMHLAAESSLINSGTNVGLPYIGPAPDLGAFETILGMPVELTSFLASVEGYNVVLKWNTATEVDNSGFDIERRVMPSGNWQTIDFVTGAGTSNSPNSYEYADQNVVSGRYAYRLKQIDATGLFKYYQEAEVVVGNKPSQLSLSEAYPNPFNPSTVIRFSVATAGTAKLRVINMLGQQIATLFSGHAEPGTDYPIQFNAASLPSGVYFSVLESNGKQEVKKMLLMK